MKAPVKLEDLMEEWNKDSVMNEAEPAKEIARIPILHAKYLSILTHHKIVVAKLLTDYNKLRKIKSDYYKGDLNNKEDLEKYGWEPQYKTVLRQDLPLYLDSDEELVNVLLKKIVNQEIVDFSTAVLKELHSRTFQLKSFIEWQKFTSGM